MFLCRVFGRNGHAVPEFDCACDTCGRRLEGYRSDRARSQSHHFCSVGHAEQFAAQVKREFTCKLCGQVCIDTGKSRQYCRPCFKKKRRAEANERHRASLVDKPCRYCGTVKPMRPGRAGFCSRPCGAKWHMENGDCEEWRLRKNERRGRDVPCIICGTMKYCTQGELSSGMAAVCGDDCRAVYTVAKARSEFNPQRGRPQTDEQKSARVNAMLEKHGVDNAFKLAKHRKNTKPQKELLEALRSKLHGHRVVPEAQIEMGQREDRAWSSVCYADILFPDRRIIVEFYGDYWHCNPSVGKYAPEFVHHKKLKTAQEIWDEDARRERDLRALDYDVIVVWEDDWKHRRVAVLDTIVARFKRHGKLVARQEKVA